ncbi:MAG: nucleotide sugar dehydrogenase [candidate division Zixibacteria bacterium]|nr:nucleotide sugar dehydrogenase [candidate division Zixibacteria bacterium]
MRISIFGMGYVGAVTAACLAKEGHRVIGVEISKDKVEQITAGKSPLVEDKIVEIISDVVRQGTLSATMDARSAINETDVSMICVGTPSRPNGDVDLTFVTRVSEKIGQVLKNKSGFHTLIYRSTIPPGTTEEVVIPILEEHSGKRVYLDFDVCFNPEFLREGSAVDDLYHPPFTVVGVQSEGAAEVVKQLFSFVNAPFEVTTIRTAEMVKYVCNVFHALKICFANEIGTLARRFGIDGHEVMRLFALDTKQNISPMYLKPGFAYGGSCLPKDVRGLLYQARKMDYAAPLIAAIPPSNDQQLDEGFQLVTSFKKKKIGFLGLAFKGGTDDLRESALVRLAERLIGKGYELLIYDRHVNLARIFGSNKAFIEKEIPHIEKLFATSIDEVVYGSEVIVVGNYDPEYALALKAARDRRIVDLVRISDNPAALGDNYHGICW